MKEYRKSQEQVDTSQSLTEFKSLSLSQMATHVITFGTKMKGKTYAEAFKDAEWTDFILSRFEKGGKLEHMMYITFVEKKLNEMTDPKSRKEQPSTSATQKPPTSPRGIVEDSFEVLSEVMPVEPEGVARLFDLEETVMELRQENQNTSMRMTNMEMSLQTIISHLQQLNVKTEP